MTNRPKRPRHLLLVGGSLLLCILAQCAPFNTYYNAKMAFDAGFKAHQRLIRANPDSTIVPSGDIASKYDRAIEKAKSVMAVYPKKKKWHDDAVFLIGKSLFFKGDYTAAVRSLRQFQMDYPGSPYIPQSYLLLGQAYMQDDNLEKAEESFNIVIERYPHLNRDEQVSLLLAKVAIRRQGKSVAIEILEKMHASVSSPEKKLELTLQMSDIYMDLKQYGKAIKLLKAVPRKETLGARMFRVDYLLLECLIAMDSLQQGLAHADQMLKTADYEHNEGRILIKKGVLLKKLGRTDESIDIFQKGARNETSAFAGAAWFELAELYLHVKGDLVKALEYYEKACAKGGDSTAVKLAQRRMKALKDLDTLRAKPSAKRDTTDTLARKRVETTPLAYTIGELFWLELDEPDSAYRHFAAVTLDTQLTPAMRSRALYSTGWLALHALKDTARADSVYARLIAEFPAGEYSKRAQGDLGRPVTIQTREDLALGAFKAAESLYVVQDNAVAAANSFLKIYRSYPECSVGPKSLYAAAWLCDEVLSKKETAMNLYEKLCAEYPDSVYCTKEAKPRLKVALDTLAAVKEHREKSKTKDKKAVKPAADLSGAAAAPGSLPALPGGPETAPADTPPVSSPTTDSSATPARPQEAAGP